MMRWLDKGKDKDKDKEKEKEKDKDKEKGKEKEAKLREKEQRKEEKEREKERKKAENGHGNNKSNKELGEVDWKGARSNLRRRSASYTNDKKVASPKTRNATYGRNSISLLDLHQAHNLHNNNNNNNNKNKPTKSPSAKGGISADARTTKQKQKEKAFLESIAQNTNHDKPSVFAIASESYKLRIVELEDEVSIANKRVSSLTDRVHMLEAEIRAANDHHTRHNSSLQEKLANVETDNAVVKNNLATVSAERDELAARLAEVEEGGSLSPSSSADKGKKREDGPHDAKPTTLAPPVAKSSSVPAVDKNVEAVLRQRLHVLEAELSAKTNDLAVLKLQTSTLEPQVKTLTHDLVKAQQDATDNQEMVTNVVEILGEWQTATETNDSELRDYLADESEVSPEEEVRRFNKKVLLLRERVSGADQTIYRIAKTVGVNSIRLDLKGDAAGKENPNQAKANASRPLRSNSLSERDAALSIKLAVITNGIELAVQKLVKGIFLNAVRSVNLGGGLVLTTELIQSLSKALLVSTTVLSVLFPNTFLGDAGAALLASAMRGNSSITNLNLEECGIGDAGVNDIAQALSSNKKAALVSLNLSHNKIGVLGSQSLATFLESNRTLTKLDLGYSQVGADSAQSIAQILKAPQNSLSHLLVPGNNFGDDGANKFATTLSTNTKLKVFNFQGNGVTKAGVTQIAQALSRCNITTLDLSRNPIGPEGTQVLAEVIKKNTILKDISLISCGITSQGAAHLAACLEHNNTLATLHLWGNKFGPSGLAAFSGCTKLGAIRTLDLRGNEFPSSAGNELSTLLSKKSTLSVLDLTGNALGPKGCEQLAKSLASSHLTALYLSGNSLGNDGVKHIAKSLGPISTLSLSLNFLGDDAMDYLAPALNASSRITNLDLSWNHIGAGGARELSKVLEKGTCLITTLNLEGNSLGPEGAVHLAASLHNNTTLTHLTLTANNFRKDGAKAVADLLKRSVTISTLNIAKNGIKDDGALMLSDALKTNNTVAHLDLSENRVENPGILALSEALKLNSSLLSINLSNNPFDRAGVMSLAQAHVRNPKVHVAIHIL